MTAGAPVHVELPDGVKVALCSHLCFRRWAVYAGVWYPDPVESTMPLQLADSCTHCAYCGDQTSSALTGQCLLHDDDVCPDWDPVQTLSAVMVCRELARRTGQHLGNLAMRYYFDLAADQRLEYDFPNVERLVDGMWNRRKYWAQPA